MLACPRCGRQLRVVTYRHAGAYRCRQCEGHAVTYPVIRESIDRGRWQRLWRKLSTNAAPAQANCPGCSKPMAEIQAEDLTIDSCRRCQLLWFDKGELQGLPKGTSPPAPSAPPATRSSPAPTTSAAQPGAPESGWQLICGWLGLPYEIDSPTTRRAYVTAATAIALIVIHFWAGPNLKERLLSILEWGFIPAEMGRHHGVTWVTSFFLHADWLHLFSNAYFLVAFGDNVEEDLGATKYGLLLAAGAVAGCALHAAMDPRSETPLVGASAGISAVLCYYAFRFPKAKIGWAWRFYFVPVWWFRMTAVTAFGIWIALQFLLAFLQQKGLTNISAMGHLGGALVGLLFVLAQRAAAKPHP